MAVVLFACPWQALSSNPGGGIIWLMILDVAVVTNLCIKFTKVYDNSYETYTPFVLLSSIPWHTHLLLQAICENPNCKTLQWGKDISRVSAH